MHRALSLTLPARQPWLGRSTRQIGNRTRRLQRPARQTLAANTGRATQIGRAYRLCYRLTDRSNDASYGGDDWDDAGDNGDHGN
jgi:hypothetical protein